MMLILYSSTIIGPAGPDFVLLDPAEAFQSLLATRFVLYESDQRADWIGNLLMLVPFGFLVAVVVLSKRLALNFTAALAAILICFVIIVAIIYL